MSDRPPVTLNVTIAPVDLPHALHVLPHQMRVWGGQVDDVQFVLDLHKSKGRYGEAADERRPGTERLLAELCAAHPDAQVRVVDYRPEVVAEVGRRWFGRPDVPPKHHYGGPVYSYFYGWHVARNDYVMHLDSDLLFGGGSQTWTREAIELLRTRPELLIASPLPGPPTPDGAFPPAVAAAHARTATPPRREDIGSLAYSFGAASTRLFLLDRARLMERVAPMELRRARLRSTLRAIAEGHAPFELPEGMFSREMQEHGLRRLDFLGSAPGLWSLHPAMRSDEFYRELPRLVERVESGDMPEAQLGDFDVNDSLIDWSSARAAARRQRWWLRLGRRARAALRGG